MYVRLKTNYAPGKSVDMWTRLFLVACVPTLLEAFMKMTMEYQSEQT